MDIPADAEITADARAAILAAFDTIEKSLPFLVSLSPDERKTLLHMGDRNKAFVERTVEGAHIVPELLPRSMTLADIDRRLTLYRALSPIVARITSLSEQVQDTQDQVGDQLCTQSLEIYRYFKAAGRTEGLDELIGNMSRRFSGQGRRKKPAPEPE